MAVKNVTDRTSNPFGMRPPFDCGDPAREPAAFGYGDANADFHVIGDHPAIHGGETTAIPFTETERGEAIQDITRATGFTTGPRDNPLLENLFYNYIHMCTPEGDQPSPASYATLERYFDAELRAINAHILLPVGERATDHVLRGYTTQRHRYGDSLPMAALHATEVRGRGFMVVPIRDPVNWEPADKDAIIDRIETIHSRDYRQTKGVATTVG